MAQATRKEDRVVETDKELPKQMNKHYVHTNITLNFWLQKQTYKKLYKKTHIEFSDFLI